MHIQRALDLAKALKQKSLFLFGPRQTGKTTLIEKIIPEALFIQLLDSQTQRYLIQDPTRLNSMIKEQHKYVVIDEIQKNPELLNEVQLLIEKRKINFLLTGSSARKLKKTGVNLLGGRARKYNLFPLTAFELKEHFNLNQVLQNGTLPSIYFSDDPKADLKAYASEYLIQEIAAEGLTRNVPAFNRFLDVAAISNAQIINYTGIASDAEVARTTVQTYFEILEDTLIGFKLPPWKNSKTRKAIGAEKFYFFDAGVVNVLCGRWSVALKTPDSGFLLETFILNELRAYKEYRQKDYEIYYWKSTSNFEVDFLLNDEVAIEVKAKDVVSEKDFKGLKAIQDEKKCKKLICIYLGKENQVHGNIEVHSLNSFFHSLWLGEFI